MLRLLGGKFESLDSWDYYEHQTLTIKMSTTASFNQYLSNRVVYQLSQPIILGFKWNSVHYCRQLSDRKYTIYSILVDG